MPLRAPKGFIDETDPKVCQIGHPAPPWLVNYADLMTELVCFFVILYALSAALDKKAKQAADDINQAQTPGVTAQVTKEGLVVTFQEMKDNAFFESGSAELTPAMEQLIQSVAPKLRGLLQKRDLIVEGHTDNVPIHNDLYLNNWELSSARATNVVEYLVKSESFPAEHMAATGYGEHRPVAPNDTLEHRKQNRRVVFLVKNAGQGSAASMGATAASGGGGEAGKAKAPGPGEGGAAGEENSEVGAISARGVSGFVEDALSRLKGK